MGNQNLLDGPGTAARPGQPAIKLTRLRTVLFAAWILLLIGPTLTTTTSANAWDIAPWQVMACTAWSLAVMLLWVPWRPFLVASYPIALIGTLMWAADLRYTVNSLEFLSVIDTFSKEELTTTLSDNLGPMVGVALILVAVTSLLWPLRLRYSRGMRVTILIAFPVLAVVVPAGVWARAWPMTLVTAGIGMAGNKSALGLISPHGRASPRDPKGSWGAHRENEPKAPETYVFVIGETVRSDRIPGCGGRSEIHRLPPDALVFCDVVSGSDATHTSVPLLVSRDVPGGTIARVTADATFLRAFEAVGFETYWLSVQEQSVAWPDARQQNFIIGRNEETLRVLDEALADPHHRKMIVIHSDGPHFAYTAHYDSSRAPFPADERLLTLRPKREHMVHYLNAYDNGIDETVRFIDQVVQRLSRQPGHAFLMTTADHGENLLDDERELFLHALTVQTRWSTQVPAVIWANEAWKSEFADQWRQLTDNRTSPVMHMDLVPTLLGAAHISYEEKRSEVVDLTKTRPPAGRTRLVQTRLGKAVDFDSL